MKKKFCALVAIATIFIFSNVNGLFSSENFRLTARVNHDVNNEQKYEEYGRKKGGSNKNRNTRRTTKNNKKGKPVYKYDWLEFKLWKKLLFLF